MLTMALPNTPAHDPYVSLATYRSNGSEVRTPVWIAPAGEHWYVFSAGDAGKVKRIRANPRARIAACDLRGNVSGTWLDVQARIVTEPAIVDRGYAALRRKYGWKMKLLDFFSGLSGKKKKRALIELRPTA